MSEQEHRFGFGQREKENKADMGKVGDLAESQRKQSGSDGEFDPAEAASNARNLRKNRVREQGEPVDDGGIL